MLWHYTFCIIASHVFIYALARLIFNLPVDSGFCIYYIASFSESHDDVLTRRVRFGMAVNSALFTSPVLIQRPLHTSDLSLQRLSQHDRDWNEGCNFIKQGCPCLISSRRARRRCVSDLPLACVLESNETFDGDGDTAESKAGIQATAFMNQAGNKVASESRSFAQGFSLPGEAEKAAKILQSFLGVSLHDYRAR